MFPLRFFRPAFRTATRSFTTSATSRTPFLARPRYHSLFANTVRQSNTGWQSAFRQAQARGYARQSYRFRRFEQSRNLFQRWAARPTFYYEVAGVGGACGGIYIYNLEEVPVSGRRRFNIFSRETEQQMGKDMYEEILKQYGNQILPPYSKEHQMVQRVLDRLIPHSGLQDEKWEIHVIDSDEKNAFVIPGGKVFVFSGILDICQGDDGLAAVLGHEIAHNVAHHAAERMSQSAVLLPAAILTAYFGDVSLGTVQLGSSLFFTLPGSRKQEEEADYIGLLMMAESCYDPSAALGLWTRMQQEEKGAPPQFLSTHPSSYNRLGKIRDWLSEAQVKRENSDCHGLTGYADDFRRAVDSHRW